MRNLTLAGLLAAAVILAGCSTLTTTTATLGYAHQPLRTDLTAGTLSGVKFGGQVVYQMDRTVSRFGGCVSAGYDWTDKASAAITADGIISTIPSHGLLGGVCHISDV